MAAAKGNNTADRRPGHQHPVDVFGSTLLLKVMERFPIIITLGGALLGFLAGEMIMTDLASRLASPAIVHCH